MRTRILTATAQVIVGGVPPVIEEWVYLDTVELIEGHRQLLRARQEQEQPLTPLKSISGFWICSRRRSPDTRGETSFAQSHLQHDSDYNVCLSVRDGDDLVGPSCFL